MKHLTLFLSLFVFHSSVFNAQNSCFQSGTSNQGVAHIPGCIEELNSLNEQDPIYYQIEAFVIRQDVSEGCSGGITTNDIENAIDFMRIPFREHNIFFIWDCNITEICDSDTYGITQIGNNNIIDLRNEGYGTNDKIDIYFFPEYDSFGDAISGGGYAHYLPTPSFPDINIGKAISIIGIDDEDTGTSSLDVHILAHEMGHILGLLHLDHIGNTNAPPVTGGGPDCNFAYDCVCDTPENAENVGTSSLPPDCSFDYYDNTLQQTIYGNQNVTKNIMRSDGERECWEFFTAGQGQRMRNYLTYSLPQRQTAAINVIENNTTFTDPIIDIDGILRVNNGATLTIPSSTIVNFSDIGSLEIQSGGRVNLYGTLSGGNCANVCNPEDCNNVWSGIKMIGNNETSQSYSSQPVLRGYPGSVIENADIAVRVYGEDALTSGGIVQCTETEFRNNRLTADFAPYTMMTNNASFFNRCTFTTDGQYDQPQRFEGFVRLETVNGIDLLGCDFVNSQDNDPPNHFYGYGYGIQAFNAGFNVIPSCTVLTYPCNDYKRSSFEGLSYGIFNITFFTKNRAYKIISADFTDNNIGAYINSVDNGTILHNVFNLGTVPNPNIFPPTGVNQIGIMFENDMGGFTFEENEFIGTAGGNVEATIGSICKNLGRFNNVVRRNEYTGVDYSNFALGENAANGDTPPRGLNYLCNENSGIEIGDFYAANSFGGQNTGNVSIRKAQGIELTNPETGDIFYGASGNKFSYSSGFDFYNEGDVLDYYYYPLNNNETPMTISGVDEEIGTEYTCPQDYCEPPCRTDTELAEGKDNYYSRKSERQATSAEYEQAILNGDSATALVKEKQMANYRREMDDEAFMVVLHLVTDTVNINMDSLQVWATNLDLFSMDMFLSLQHQSGGDIVAAQAKLNEASRRTDLTPRERQTLREMPDLLTIVRGKRPSDLSKNDLSSLEKLAQDDYSFVGNISRNLLTLHGYYFIPTFDLPIAKERTEENNFLNTRNGKLFIYPNPANSHLTFSVPQSNENYSVEIMNISGILLKKFNMVSGETKVISTNNLSVGLQFYRVTSSSGNISTGKIFIQK